MYQLSRSYELSDLETAASRAPVPLPEPLLSLAPEAASLETRARRSMIVLDGVSKVFGSEGPGGVTAIDGIDLDIPPNSLTLITGPNGSGKTTLLGIMGCMMRPTAGRVTVSGRDITRLSEDLLAEMRRTHFGWVFQNRHLVRGATAIDNVMLPGVPCAGPNGDLRHRARALLAGLGLESRADTRVELLSGGEQQRVALARAVVNDPQVVIADEPTAHLDAWSAKTFLNLMVDLLGDGRSMIVTSHDPALCRSKLFSRVVELQGGRLTRH
jgi:putative ABC transport system ATP-binding protein